MTLVRELTATPGHEVAVRHGDFTPGRTADTPLRERYASGCICWNSVPSLDDWSWREPPLDTVQRMAVGDLQSHRQFGCGGGRQKFQVLVHLGTWGLSDRLSGVAACDGHSTLTLDSPSQAAIVSVIARIEPTWGHGSHESDLIL